MFCEMDDVIHTYRQTHITKMYSQFMTLRFTLLHLVCVGAHLYFTSLFGSVKLTQLIIVMMIYGSRTICNVGKLVVHKIRASTWSKLLI